MVTRSPFTVVRWTHLPTGVTAQADGEDHARTIHARVRWAATVARKHLMAKLCRPDATPIRRTYQLDPPWDMEPYVRQDGVSLAVGREGVTAMLDGKIPEPKGQP